MDERHGVRYGHGNPMRRAAEKKYVKGISQFGIRNVISTAKSGYDDAKEMGSDILSVRQFRKIGPKNAANRIPRGRVYVTIDIDAFCPSIAPGTGTPSHGGFLYYDVLELLQEVSKKNAIIGTASDRREFQIKNIRPDINCKLIRGNVDTRIKKLKDG